VDWFGTLRGRVGYASDRWMLYGTGGYAYGRNHIEIVGNSAFSSSPTESGWTAGGGLEYAFAPNWTAKFEYLHVDLGDRIRWTTFTPVGAPDPGFARVSFDAVRVGLNYKFGSGR
jgi:outer membrane immunogenic protein